jgi:superoxide dismutase, Cu-Zn family
MKTALCAAICFFAASATLAQSSSHSSAKPITVPIINADGHNIGSATLSPAPKGVKIVFDVKNLPPGDHPIHIHANAKCDPPDFKSSGAHFEGAAHNHAAPAGDIPNFVLTVNDDRKAHVSTIAPFVTMGNDDNSIFSNGGTAIIIHATSSEVNGGAPPRIACAAITKPA